MAKPLLTLVDGRAVNAADRSLAALLEECLCSAETVRSGVHTRQSYWTRLFNGAARGNPLARHLAERESAFLAGHGAAVGTLHSQVTGLALYLKAEGYLPMIQIVPFAVSGPEGSSQATADRAARLATAWLLAHAPARVVLQSCQHATNLVVGLSGQTTYFYTLTLVVDVPGATAPLPWGDAADPPEWRALGAPPAATPSVPPPGPGATAPPLADLHQTIHGLMQSIGMTPEHAKLFLNRYHVERISQLDATSAAALLAVLQSKAAAKGVAG